MNRRTLVLVPDEWSRKGGLEIVTQNIAKAFYELGWRVVVIPARGHSDGRETAGIEMKWLSPKGRWRASIWHRFLRWRQLAKAVERELTEGGLLILGHVQVFPLLDYLTETSKISRWVWTHGVEAWGIAARRWMPQMNRLDRIVAVSAYTAWHEKHEGATVPISVVPNSIDTARFVPTQTSGKIRRDEILICGRLAAAEQYKGHEVLFEALPIVQQLLGHPVTLRIIGTGDDEHRLKERAVARGLDVCVPPFLDMDKGSPRCRVLFCGRVTDDALLEAYQHCGVFAMPSQAWCQSDEHCWVGEGFGLVYVEAEACGRPVVCSTDGGAPETTLHEKTGLIVDPRSPQANAEAIARILKDPAWADELGTNGYRFATENFSFERFKQRIAEVLGEDTKLGMTLEDKTHRQEHV